MILALGHAFSLKNIFENFSLKKLKMKCKDCFNIIGDNHREKLAYKIFLYSMNLVFNDIIDNNVTFELPTGSRRADIHLKRFADDNFRMLRLLGKWQDVDYLASMFSGYQMTLTMYDREGKPSREKPIYMDKRLNKKLVDYINNGKQYC